MAAQLPAAGAAAVPAVPGAPAGALSSRRSVPCSCAAMRLWQAARQRGEGFLVLVRYSWYWKDIPGVAGDARSFSSPGMSQQYYRLACFCWPGTSRTGSPSATITATRPPVLLLPQPCQLPLLLQLLLMQEPRQLSISALLLLSARNGTLMQTKE